MKNIGCYFKTSTRSLHQQRATVKSKACHHVNFRQILQLLRFLCMKHLFWDIQEWKATVFYIAGTAQQHWDQEFSVKPSNFCCLAFSFPPSGELDRENSAQARGIPVPTWAAAEVQSWTFELRAVPWSHSLDSNKKKSYVFPFIIRPQPLDPPRFLHPPLLKLSFPTVSSI